MHSYSAAALAVLALLQPTTALPGGNYQPPPYLNELAQEHGKLWFGTAADIPGTNETSDPGYMSIVTNEKIFGQLTPANMMKVRISFSECSSSEMKTHTR
jgi:endo-1,4-beta-xylanase